MQGAHEKERMNSSKKLPDNVIDFLFLIGFLRLLELAPQNLKTLGDIYSEIKSLELENLTTAPKIKGLIELLGTFEENIELQSKTGKTNFKNLLSETPLKSFKSLKRNLWFISQEYPNPWKISQILDLYSKAKLRASKSLDNSKQIDELTRELKSLEDERAEKIRKEIKSQIRKKSLDRLSKAREMLPAINFSDELKRSKPTKQQVLEQAILAPKIGFGLESSYKQNKVMREEVKIDANTTPKNSSRTSILYAAGWSLTDSADEPSG